MFCHSLKQHIALSAPQTDSIVEKSSSEVLAVNLRSFVTPAPRNRNFLLAPIATSC